MTYTREIGKKMFYFKRWATGRAICLHPQLNTRYQVFWHGKDREFTIYVHGADGKWELASHPYGPRLTKIEDARRFLFGIIMQDIESGKFLSRP